MVAVAPAPVDWPAARAAVATACSRVTSLLRSASSPTAPALGDWDVTDVALHLSHAVDAVSAMAKGGGNVLDDIWSLSVLTKVMVEGEGKRPLTEVADRIEASTAAFLAAMEQASDDGLRNWWVRGTAQPLSTLTCHLLNELVVHGRDIAVAEGVPWPIERGHANLIVNGFLFPVLGSLGRAMLSPAGAGADAVFDVRVRGGGRAWLRFGDGDFTVTTSAQGPVDCHLSVDPEAFLLLAWGRLGQWPAIARGKLLSWGRKPWLGLRLRSWLKNP
jgi:uncharacterized protein (TIGR03083 family)